MSSPNTKINARDAQFTAATQLHWDKMTPYERDILIAEKVFGHRVIQIADKTLISPYGKPDRTEVVPAYSTDMNAAMQIVALNKFPHISMLKSNIQPGNYLCTVFDGNPYATGRRYNAYAPTLSEAICIAALKAVGVEVAR